MSTLLSSKTGAQRDLEDLERKLAETEARLAEAQELIRAMRSGEAIGGTQGEPLHTPASAEQDYRALVEAMFEGAATLGADGTVLYCNQHLSSLLNVPLEQIIGKLAHRLFWDEAERFERLIAATIAGDSTRAWIDLRTAEGRRVPAQVSLSRMAVGEAATVSMAVTDLTKVRARGEALRESDLTFEALANHVPQLVWMCAPDGENFYFNQRWVDYTGLTLEESYGRGWNARFHPDDKQAAMDAWSYATRTGEQYRVECRLRAADGSYRWYLMRREPLMEADGRVTRWFGTCTDIDNLKRAEAELNEHREHLESLVTERTLELWTANVKLENDIAERKHVEADLRRAKLEWERTFNSVPDLVAILDNQRRIVRVNQAMAHRLGATPEACVGQRCFESVHGCTGPIENCPHTLTLQDGLEHVAEIHEARLGGDFLVSTTPLLDERGAMNGVVHVARDITKRKLAEGALRESEEKYRTLFDTLIEGFCIIEMIFDELQRPVDYRFLEVNPALEMLTGLHEAQGKTMRELAPGIEEFWFETYGRVALTGEQERFENEVKAFNKWYAVFAYRVGGPESRKVAVLFNDITERKQAEEAVRESEEQFRKFANLIPQLCWMAGADGSIFWYNERWYQYTGTTPQEMEGWGWQSVHDPDALPKVLERWKSSIATGQPFDMVFPLRSANGVFRPFLTRIMPVLDANGEVVRWFGTNTDITERKRAEELLETTLQRFYAILSSLNSAVLLATNDGRVEFANQAFCDLFEYMERPADVVGLNSPDVIEKVKNRYLHPDQAATRIMEIVDRGQAIVGEEVALRDGLTYLRDFVPLIVDGKSHGRMWVHTNISESKRAEEALRSKETRLRLALDAAKSGTWEWDLRTNKNEWSYEIWGLYGLKPFSCTPSNETWLSAVHPEDRELAEQKVKDAAANHTELNCEYRVPGVGGQTRWLATRGQPLFDDKNEAVSYIGIVSDITDRRRATQALIQSEKLASVGRLASTIAHEINNPLEAIGNTLYLAITDPDISPLAKSYLDMATHELERVTHITRQTLAFHRDTKSPKPTDLRECLDGVLNLFANRLRTRGIAVERRYGAAPPIQAVGGEIRQIVSNLLSNSLDALSKDGKLICRVHRSVGRGGAPAVRLTIADTGSGILPEHLKRIFEPFFTTKEFVGTGLGLWITKEIAEKHVATIRMRSKPAKGTVVSIAFPIVNSNQ